MHCAHDPWRCSSTLALTFIHTCRSRVPSTIVDSRLSGSLPPPVLGIARLRPAGATYFMFNPGVNEMTTSLISQQTGAHPYPAAQLTSHTETRRGTDPPNDHAMPPSVPIRGLLPGVVLRSSGLLRALRGSAGGTGRAPSRSLRLTSACNAVTTQAFGFHFVGTPSADPRCVHGTTRRAGVLLRFGAPPTRQGDFVCITYSCVRSS